MTFSTLLGLLALSVLARAVPYDIPSHNQSEHITSASASLSVDAAASCFPAQGFTMPSTVPGSTAGWWCDPQTEYAFLGFSYSVAPCQSRSQLNKEFADIRNRFKSRYVRLYGTCDRPGFYDDVVDAAWNNVLGVHALIWFGWDDPDAYVGRRDTLFAALHANKKAKFVTRVVQFGSEPLYDWAISHQDLTKEVKAAKKNLASLNIPVTVSELAWGYQLREDAPDVLAAIDSINMHVLPYWDPKATTSANAWPTVLKDVNWFITHGNGKKMYFSQTGWPTRETDSIHPTDGAKAVADIANAKGYYVLLDQHCTDLKAAPGGGVGWFSHLYSDAQDPGYGIVDVNGKLKFPFQPLTSC